MDQTKFRWAGSTYACRIIGEGTEGRTRVEALEHGPRFGVGTELDLKPDEIILPFDTSTPPVPPNDPDALQKAMDEERTTLPPVAEVLADPNPTPPLSASSQAAAPTTKEAPMADATDTAAAFSRIQEKAKLAAGAPGEVAAAVEATLDDILAKKKALLQKNSEVHAKHTKVIEDASAGLEIMDSALRQISNGGPA